jgi:hypothetical protein
MVWALSSPMFFGCGLQLPPLELIQNNLQQFMGYPDSISRQINYEKLFVRCAAARGNIEPQQRQTNPPRSLCLLFATLPRREYIDAGVEGEWEVRQSPSLASRKLAARRESPLMEK